MGRGADLVLQECVGRKLAAPLFPRPLLGGLEEGASDALEPGFGDDVPALEVGDGIGVAPFGIRTDRQLGEADGGSGVIEGEQHPERVTQAAREVARDFESVVARAFEPERAS